MSLKKKSEKIELKKHNEETYNSIKNLFNEHDRVSVVQATGSGKSYIIAKLIEDNNGKNIFLGSPSTNINTQFQDKFPNLMKDVEFYTYSKLLFIKASEIKNFKFDIIILDEFHRLGAEKWSKAINRILELNPNAKVLGTSATPIRYLDGEKNMVDVLFNGVCANNMNLSDAIKKNILPKPRMVTALYDIKKDHDTMLAKINQSCYDKDLKLELKEKVKGLAKNFRNGKNIVDIFKKYLSDENKIIVFCENINHIFEMEKNVCEWIRESTKKEVYSYKIYSGNPKNNFLIKDFELAFEEGVHILFSVNMLNEGLHIKDVNCAIFLRSTLSPTIYYQQLGRVITANSKESPLIFDLVNNSKTLGVGASFGGCKEWKKGERNQVDNGEFEFYLYDESIDIVNKLDEIENLLSLDWDYMFDELVQYKEKYGHCIVTNEHPKLNRWTIRERQKLKTMPQERIDKLNDIGFCWNILDMKWMNSYHRLLKFKKIHGHVNVTRNHGDFELYEWVKSQRDKKNHGTLAKKRIEMLDDIGINWRYQDEIFEKRWNMMFERLLKFKDKYGHVDVKSRYEDRELANWVGTQRKIYRDGKMKECRKKRLEEVGFNWIAPNLKRKKEV